MLVSFRFKNFGPFKEDTFFDMRAVSEDVKHPDNLITEYADLPLLKVATIYGANASGKTQFVQAYHTFFKIVIFSFSQNNKADDDTPLLAELYNSFFLDSEAQEECIEFEGIYRLGRHEYKYGFAFDSNSIQYEWLYRTSLVNGRQETILERDGTKIELGDSVKKSCEKYVSNIDSDVLVLSFMRSLKLRTSVFYDVVYCVKDILPVYLSGDFTAKRLLTSYFEKDFDEEEKENLLKFLKAVDTGIIDIVVEKKGKNTSVYTRHLGKDRVIYEFPISIESDGTRRAIAVYSLIRTACLGNKGLLIDEFHSQLHPLLQKYIIDLFYERCGSGQLIYTTHDTTLLDEKYVRRDQIWFVDKNEAGESSLYSLSEFGFRNECSFETDYLSGRYGGIPNLKDFSFDGGNDHAEG